MSLDHFDEASFRAQVDKALKAAKTVLDVNRTPELAEDVGHSYADKYTLVEMITRAASSGVLNAFQSFGLNDKGKCCLFFCS